MKDILNRAAQLADHAEIFFLESTSTSVGFSSNKLKGMDASENRGIGIRMIKNGRLAQASSSNLTNVTEFLPAVADLCQHGDPVRFEFAPDAPLSNLQLYNPAVEQDRTEEYVARGEEIIRRVLAHDPHLLTHCGFGQETLAVRVLNSRGVDAGYRKSEFSAGVLVQVVEGQNIVYVHESYRGLTPCEYIEEMVESVLRDSDLARKTVACDGGQAEVIITPEALADILIAFEEGISGENAARGISPLHGKLGEQIFDERITIIDDPTCAGGRESQPFDDEGIPSRATPIVTRGVFNNFITDLRSSAELGCPSTGNGLRMKPLLRSREYGAGVGPATTNLIFLPGDRSRQEMIKSITTGLIVNSITGILLGNLTNGDFSGNIALGYLVRDGQPVGRVKDTMIAGNIYDAFLHKLVGLSQERKWTGNFGGGSGSYLLPWLHLRDIDISV